MRFVVGLVVHKPMHIVGVVVAQDPLVDLHTLEFQARLRYGLHCADLGSKFATIEIRGQ